MSLRVSEVISSVRATLDYPPLDKLKPQTLLLKLREKVDFYFTRMGLTDRNWFLDSDVLTVNSSEDEFLITSPQWGRPILCETQDLSDPNHIRRSVPIIDLQDRELFYNGTQSGSIGIQLGNKHSASSFAFFRRPSGDLRVKITPQPSQQADYILWYEPDRPSPLSLSGNLTFLDQFNNLLVADLSLTLLPYCEYDAIILSETAYRKRTKEDSLKEGLTRDYQLYAQTFEEFIQQDRQEKVERKLLWGESPSGEGWNLY